MSAYVSLITWKEGHTISIHSTVSEIVSGIGLMSTELVHCFHERTSWLAELDHAGLQVVQGSFHETVLLLVVCQKIMPQRMLHHVVN